MKVTGVVRRVVSRDTYNGGKMLQLDVMDPTAGRVSVVYYPDHDERFAKVDDEVDCTIGQVRVWRSQRGNSGVSLQADSVVVMN